MTSSILDTVNKISIQFKQIESNLLEQQEDLEVQLSQIKDNLLELEKTDKMLNDLIVLVATQKHSVDPKKPAPVVQKKPPAPVVQKKPEAPVVQKKPSPVVQKKPSPIGLGIATQAAKKAQQKKVVLKSPPKKNFTPKKGVKSIAQQAMNVQLKKNYSRPQKKFALKQMTNGVAKGGIKEKIAFFQGI